MCAMCDVTYKSARFQRNCQLIGVFGIKQRFFVELSLDQWCQFPNYFQLLFAIVLHLLRSKFITKAIVTRNERIVKKRGYCL